MKHLISRHSTLLSSLLQRPRQPLSLLSTTRSFSFRQFSNSSIRRAAIDSVSQTKSSLSRRALSVVAIAFFFASAGFAMGAAPVMDAVNGFLNPPSDYETLSMYTPEDESAQEIEDFINQHPLAVELRSKPEYSESRPHMKMPPTLRGHSLTGGTLMGPGRVVVPPVTWSEAGGKSLVSISYLGADLCGHPGIIHGGFIATMLDEGLAKCCFAALPNKIGVTANLNINYRKPAPAEAFVVLRARTTKVEGRKAWVEGRIETLVGEGETPVVLAEATALFIEPRQAAKMTRVYPVS